jgi:hypothetical protein
MCHATACISSDNVETACYCAGTCGGQVIACAQPGANQRRNTVAEAGWWDSNHRQRHAAIGPTRGGGHSPDLTTDTATTGAQGSRRPRAATNGRPAITHALRYRENAGALQWRLLTVFDAASKIAPPLNAPGNRVESTPFDSQCALRVSRGGGDPDWIHDRARTARTPVAK